MGSTKFAAADMMVLSCEALQITKVALKDVHNTEKKIIKMQGINK